MSEKYKAPDLVLIGLAYSFRQLKPKKITAFYPHKDRDTVETLRRQTAAAVSTCPNRHGRTASTRRSGTRRFPTCLTRFHLSSVVAGHFQLSQIGSASSAAGVSPASESREDEPRGIDARACATDTGGSAHG